MAIEEQSQEEVVPEEEHCVEQQEEEEEPAEVQEPQEDQPGTLPPELPVRQSAREPCMYLYVVESFIFSPFPILYLYMYRKAV